MIDFCSGRYALGVCAAAAMLAGCGGSQRVSETGALQQGVVPTRVEHGRSWMKPGTSSEDLLYVSVSSQGVYVFTYPGGTQVGMLTGFVYPEGMCTDGAGNVWIADSDAGTIDEYAHGGTTQIATLSDTHNYPNDCSVDPESGNLAVSNDEGGQFGAGSLAVYADAMGSASIYSTDEYIGSPFNVTYDNAGNVFAVGPGYYYVNKMVWLPKGGSSVELVTLKPRLPPGGVQWDGKYLAAPSDGGGMRRYRVKNGYGKEGNRFTTFNNCCYPGNVWIAGSTLIGGDTGNAVGFWKYPKGGNATQTISLSGEPNGITVSLASSRSRIRK